MGMFALVPGCILTLIPMALTNGDEAGALNLQLWAGVFVATWLAMLLWGLFSRVWQFVQKPSAASPEPAEPP